MSQPNRSTSSEDARGLAFGQRYRRSTLYIVGMIAIITLVVMLIILSMNHIQISRIGGVCLMTLIYTALIALPSRYLLPWIGERFSCRYPRLVFAMIAACLICTAVFGCLVGSSVALMIGMIPTALFWNALWGDLPFTVLISLTIGLGMTVYESLQFKYQLATLELRNREMEQDRATKLLAEARLSSLESRIHPHFLFNTLNSIAALIPSDPVRAEDTVGKLASLLRFSLNATQGGLVPLSKEARIVRDYLEIEKTRFGTRLNYEIQIPEALADCKVPPLALQSLVENAVKHVVAHRTQGSRITVTGTIKQATLRLEVSDDGPGFTLDAITPQHGLGNLIGRIELLFGEAGHLEVTRIEDQTVVRMEFPA